MILPYWEGGWVLIGGALSQRLCQLLLDRAEDCTHAWLSSAHCHAGGGAPLSTNYT